MMIEPPTQLSDDRLTSEISRLARSHRSASAHLVAYLAVFEDRGLHLQLGYKSLYRYCCDVLHLSEHEAYNRIEAVHTARKFPQILEMMQEGALTLTGVRLLAPVLTPDNHGRLLEAAAYKRKGDVEELIARERPRADVPTTLRKLPVVTPLSPGRYELRLTVSEETRDKLLLARDLLSHAVPSGDAAEILDRALTLLNDDLLRTKFAIVGKARRGRSRPAADPTDIPAEVKRAVYLRDGGRCAYVGRGGRRCNSRLGIQFHHLQPRAASGPGTVDNIRLSCRAHNRYEAAVYFGPIWQQRAALESVPPTHPG